MSYRCGAIILIGLLFCSMPARAADWKAKPDVPTETIAWPADLKIKIAAPKSFFDAEITFADGGGPFVALGRNGAKEEHRDFFDLRTGKKIGTLRGQIKIEKPFALSPDGQLFVGSHGAFKGGVTVFDVATGKVVQEITLQKSPEYLEFAGKDRILIFNQWAGAKVEQFEARTGKALQEIAINKDGRKGNPVTSPGGAYMALADNKVVHIYELASGDEVGTLDPPPGKNGPSGCIALAFSPEGTQIAGLFEDWGEHHITSWYMKDGSPAGDLTVEKPKAAFYEGRKLDWIPDGSGWLVNGETVIDKESGKALWKLPEDVFQKLPRRIAAAETVINFDTRDRNNRTLVAFSQGKDKIAAVRKAVREGGSATDVGLPALKAIDLKQAKVVQVPLSSPWGVQADAAADVGAVARRPVPIACKGNEIETLRVLGGAQPSAIVELANRNGPFGKADDTQGRRVDRLDLTTGKVSGHVALPAGFQVLSVSPDGKILVSSDIQEERRIDVWSLENGKQVIGWRPYEGTASAPKPQAPGFPNAPTTHKLNAYALSAEQIVTVSAEGKIILWALPDCKPVYVAEVADFAPVSVSPGGKYLVGLQRGIVRFVELATGKMAGDLEPPFPAQVDQNAPKVVAIRPDGKEAAAVLGKNGDVPHLVRWDLTNGKVVEDITFRMVPPGGIRLQYAGPKHLLLEDRDLYDLERRATVWTYNMQVFEGKFAVERPDGRCWYAVSEGFNKPGSAVGAAALPEPDVEKYVKTIADGPGALLKQGASVVVSVNYNGGQSADAKAKTLELLRQSFERRGLKLADSGDLVVQLNVNERSTGENLEFRKMFPHFGDNPFARMTVPIIELECQSTLFAGGQQLWQSPMEKFSMRHIFGIIHLPDKNTDLTTYLHGQLWGTVPSWADRAVLPRFLARTSDGVQALPGNTTLTATGTDTHKPTVTTKGK